jgi:hypothetical protein
MNKPVFSIALLCALSATATLAESKGCLKGAAVGGVAGHVAGQHAVLGAAAGCAVGHHEAKVKDKKAAADAQKAQQANTVQQPSVQPQPQN